MTKPILYIKDSDNKRVRVVVDIIPDWEGFDKLVKYLEINYKANVLESYDGPDARRWIIEVKGKIIELIHQDGFGNYFLAPAIESEEVINEIGKDLEERLKDVEE